MKQQKNEIEMLGLINKIQEQLVVLDKKVDTLIHRSLPESRPAPKPPVEGARRMMHKAICADCQKECTIPFKPSPDRPVYCQDCFSRRKVITISKMGVDKPPINIQQPQVKEKKKVLAVKKPAGKKKLVPKKK